MALCESGKKEQKIMDALFDRHRGIIKQIDELYSVTDFPDVNDWRVIDAYVEMLMYDTVAECIVKIISNKEEDRFSLLKGCVMERIEQVLDDLVFKAVGKYGKLPVRDRD